MLAQFTTTHLQSKHLYRIHAQCGIHGRSRVRVPRGQPLIASQPKVTHGIRRCVRPRLATHIVRKIAACAARCHVQNDVELTVERSVRAAAMPRILATESATLVVTVTGFHSTNYMSIQTELQMIC